MGNTFTVMADGKVSYSYIETTTGINISGYAPAVCKKVAEYFDIYDPAGYNTRMESCVLTEFGRTLTVYISRWSSCD